MHSVNTILGEHQLKKDTLYFDIQVCPNASAHEQNPWEKNLLRNSSGEESRDKVNTWTPHTYLRTHFTAYFNVPSYNPQTCLPTNLIILGGARQQDGGGLPHRLVPWLDCLVLRGQRLGPGGEGGRHVLPHLQPLLQQGAGGGVGQARPHLVGPRHLPAGHRGGRVLHGKQRPWRGLRNGRFSSGCRSQDSRPTFHVQGWCESRTGMLKKRRCHPNSFIAMFHHRILPQSEYNICSRSMEREQGFWGSTMLGWQKTWRRGGGGRKCGQPQSESPSLSLPDFELAAIVANSDKRPIGARTLASK